MRRQPGVESYNLNREGCFGTFATKNGFPILFVQTTFRSTELQFLETAKDALTGELNFEQLIQREINEAHVGAIRAYVEDEKRIRFFPPLLVALVQIDQAKRLAEHYPPLTVSDAGPATQPPEPPPDLVLTWGNVFQVRLGRPDLAYPGGVLDVTLPTSNQVEKVIPYLCTLRVAMGQAKLIVVDGQHRLKALQYLSEKKPEMLEPLALPVCIFFPGWGGPLPTILDALRTIFVDVNNEAKRVSGHFTILLKDSDMAAIAVRALCESWRKSDRLTMIEWSGHEDKFSYQLKNSFSVTGVGVLYNAISDSGAKARHVEKVFHDLLQLETVRDELEKRASLGKYSSLVEWAAPFDLEQRELLKRQIDSHFTPVLDALLRDLEPYKRIADIASSSVNGLDTSEPAKAEAAAAFLGSTRPSSDGGQAAYVDLLKKIQEQMSGAKLNFALYRTQRFQQGLLGAFYEVYYALWAAHLDSLPTGEVVARRFVDILNTVLYPKNEDTLFAKSGAWLSGTITAGKGGDVLAKKGTRVRVTQLLLAVFGLKKNCARFAGLIADADQEAKALSKLEDAGRSAALGFWKAHREYVVEAFVSELEYQVQDEDQRRELESLLMDSQIARTEKAREKAGRQLRERAEELLKDNLDDTRRRLERVLGYQLEAPAPKGSDDEEDDE